MKISFLGTGTSQGVPMIACPCDVCQSTDSLDQRLRSAILIQTDHYSIVVDTGPDFRTQMLRNKITKVDGILFTHEHKDHSAGLDDVRGFNYFMQCDMPIYGSQHCIDAIKRDYQYIFREKKYPGIPELAVHILPNEAFEFCQHNRPPLRIMPIEVMHYKLPVYGYRIGRFAYITDANYISETELEKLQGVQTLVLNALRHEPHLSHFTLKEAIEIAQQIGAENTYFTHISHQLGKHKEIEPTLPEGMHLAYDGLSIEENEY
jgi:phosphoribosyl 1,2-cyclic phosphate phosphodiesterase